MITWSSIASLRPSSVHPGPQHQAELAFDPSGCLSHLTSRSMVTLGALLRKWSWPFLSLPYFCWDSCSKCRRIRSTIHALLCLTVPVIVTLLVF